MLSELIIKHAKPKDKKYCISDGRGLIVEIRPNGQKYFIVRAFKDGKEKRKHLGVYPEISLREARVKAVEARKDILILQLT